MFIGSNEEIIITKIVNEIKDIAADHKKDTKEIRSLVSEAIKDNKEYIFNIVSKYLLQDDKDDNISISLLEKFIKEAIQYKETQNKKLVLFAIPVIFLECYSLNNIYTKSKNFDNNLKGIDEKIKNDLYNIAGDSVSITIHDELIDYSAFSGSYKRINNLIEELSMGNALLDDSILKSNLSYKIEREQSFDNLKFVLGLIEMDSELDTYDVFDIFTKNIEQLTDTFSLFEQMLFAQKISATSVITLNPMVLTTALNVSRRRYFYYSNKNLISKIVQVEDNFDLLIGSIIIDVTNGEISVGIAKKDLPDSYVFYFTLDYPIMSYENELNDLSSIFKELGIEYAIKKK